MVAVGCMDILLQLGASGLMPFFVIALVLL